MYRERRVIPRDGAWSRGQRWKNDALYWSAACAVGIGKRIPRRLLPLFGSLLGSIAYLGLARARRTAIANLGLVFPTRSKRTRRAMAHRVFRCLGQNLTDTLALLDPRELAGRTLHVSRESGAVLSRALDEGRGVIYVTGHLGPWERMAGLLSHQGYPITTLARESYDPRFEGLIYDRLRRDRDVEVIYRGAPGAAVATVRALRRGRVLGFLMDMPGRVPTRPVELLGRPSRAPLGPARLALRLRCPVVVGTPAPAPSGQLEVKITRLSLGDLVPGESGEAALTQRMADALGDRIRALPTAWPWMHPSF